MVLTASFGRGSVPMRIECDRGPAGLLGERGFDPPRVNPPELLTLEVRQPYGALAHAHRIAAFHPPEGRLDAEAAFEVSQLDETFQLEAWGEDTEAMKRRELLAEDIEAAARFLELLALR